MRQQNKIQAKSVEPLKKVEQWRSSKKILPGSNIMAHLLVALEEIHKKNIFCWLSKAVLWLLNMVAVKYKTQNVIRRPNKNGPVKWYKSYTILCWCLSKLKSIVCFYLQLIWSYSWYDVWSLTQYLLAQPHSVQTKMKDGIDNKQSELE